MIAETMSQPEEIGIYLDNAATSFPKPDSVYEAVNQYQRQLGAAAGRGGYRAAIESNRILSSTRTKLARLINSESDRQIIFTFSGTDSLTLGITGLLEAGDHVVITQLEHNSILRPIEWLKKNLGITVTSIEPDLQSGQINPEEIKNVLRPNTKLVCCTHASNVTGVLQPVESIGKILKDHSAHFLVDGAQTVGHILVDVQSIQCDLFAAPAHKGLLGPLGTGFLYVNSKLENTLNPVRLGGTGTESESPNQPDQLPEKLESGNHNMPGIAGLSAGIDFINKKTIHSIAQDEQKLISHLIEKLKPLESVEIMLPNVDPELRINSLSLKINSFEPQIFASLLDEAFGIQVRAGYHCSPLAHKDIGTFECGGTVRVSVGWSTTLEHIDQFAEAVKSLTAGI